MWEPWDFSDLDFLYIFPRFTEDCPHAPILSEDQSEMVDKYKEMIDRGEVVPSEQKLGRLPLVPDTCQAAL